MPKRHWPEFISPDENVKLPRQLRVASERAEASFASRPPRPVAIDVGSLTNAQIDGVLERLDRGELIISDRDPGAVNAIVREGVRRIKADRQKAQTPKAQAARKAKDAAVKRRHQFLIQAALRLPPKRLQHLTGAPTIERLIRDVRKKLGDTVTAATIKQDIRKLPILRAVQEGRITTVKWERYVAKDMRDRYEHVVFRFNKAMMSIFDKLMSLYQKAPKSGCTLLTT